MHRMYLEDGLPGRTDTWLITMVIVSSLSFQMAMKMAYKGGVTNYLLNGMILQVGKI